MIGLALGGIPAARRPHVQALPAGPRDGQGHLPDRIGRLVVLGGLRIHVAKDHRADLGHGYRLSGDLGNDLLSGLIQLLVINVSDHQHVLREHQHSDVPADLGTVEMGLQVDQVGEALPAVQGVIDDVGHQPWVETCLLQRLVQALSLRAVMMGGVVPGVGRTGLRRRRLGAHSPPFSQIAW